MFSIGLFTVIPQDGAIYLKTAQFRRYFLIEGKFSDEIVAAAK
jgi:hypothetical protein